MARLVGLPTRLAGCCIIVLHLGFPQAHDSETSPQFDITTTSLADLRWLRWRAAVVAVATCSGVRVEWKISQIRLIV
ncbi:hypothetical protein CRG98_020351 [Punica granatum]|uniref:Secreted protein n=1 Tax=Punica granatum TaxID=22663 RepID=A0A2I0JSN6_PUNGR|nr:hypothetical protein CRG98_020351 [Punica granatum]